MKVHALASHEHYLEHLSVIHSRLPESLRGELLYVYRPKIRDFRHWHRDDVVLVAGYSDVDAAFGRRVIYVEHGAGQRYDSPNPAARRHYHGSDHPENVVGYIAPRRDVAASWGRPAFAAGSPVCDPYELFSAERVAAITFHWNASAPIRVGVPEAGTAFDHYAPQMKHIVAELQVEGWEVIGARHPRFNAMRGFWDRLGVREVSAAEIRRRAQLLIADNTSLMYEMAYLGRDVITLNAPWFRRDVEHGLRFWEWVPGLQVNDPYELIDVIGELDKGVAAVQLGLTEYVYGKALSDGLDGQRAATWITAFASTL